MFKGSAICNIVYSNTGISSSVECLAEGLIALLSGRVPDLHVDCHSVISTDYFQLFAKKICSDGGLVGLADALANVVLDD